jgi:hypothetical protein
VGSALNQPDKSFVKTIFVLVFMIKRQQFRKVCRSTLNKILLVQDVAGELEKFKDGLDA